jgi:hypothetical protein
MIEEPHTNGNPGCPECVHIHWRWGQLLNYNDPVGGTVVSPRFNNNGGNANVPANSNQDVDVAVDFLNTSETALDPSGQLWANSQTIFGGTLGVPLEFWYSGTGHSSSDSFFVHGGFFSSLRVSIGNPSVYGIPFPIPLPIVLQSFACPTLQVIAGLCPIVSSITNNTGDPMQWTATFTLQNGNPIVGGVAATQTIGNFTGLSGNATIFLPGGVISGQTLILTIQVTDLATQWSTQRQAYVTTP